MESAGGMDCGAPGPLPVSVPESHYSKDPKRCHANFTPGDGGNSACKDLKNLQLAEKSKNIMYKKGAIKRQRLPHIRSDAQKHLPRRRFDACSEDFGGT